MKAILTDVDLLGLGQVHDAIQTVREFNTPGVMPRKSMADYLQASAFLAEFYVKYFDPRPVSLEYVKQHCSLAGRRYENNRYYFEGGYSVWDHTDEDPNLLVIDLGDIELRSPSLGQLRRLHWALTGRDLEEPACE